MEEQEEIELLKQKELSQTELKVVCDTAVEAFQQGKYEIAIQLFILLYQKGFAQEQVLETILSCYYEPSREKFKKFYDKNVICLKRYSYMVRKDFPLFKDLKQRPIPMSENQYAAFNLADRQFGETIQVKTEKEGDPFFLDLSETLLIKNEFNLLNLKYLWDNMRRSEDYGGDNHIYLYYDSFDTFCLYLQLLDLENLLRDEKFVFLFGQDQREQYYPLNFQREFGMDDDLPAKKTIRVEEVKKIILCVDTLSDAEDARLNRIMSDHPALAAIPGFDYSWFSRIYGEHVEGKDAVTVVDDLRGLSEFDLIGRGDQDQFFHILLESLKHISMPTKGDWFKGIHIAYSMVKHGGTCGRIVPVIYYSCFRKSGDVSVLKVPEADEIVIQSKMMSDLEQMQDILCEFSYCIPIVIDYPPVHKVKRLMQFCTDGWPCYFASIIHLIFERYEIASRLEKCYLFSYENLSQSYEKSLFSICEAADIPCGKEFLETSRAVMASKIELEVDQLFCGDMLNLFDFYRIELLLLMNSGDKERRLFYTCDSYGEKTRKFTVEEMQTLFLAPFKFEMFIETGFVCSWFKPTAFAKNGIQRKILQLMRSYLIEKLPGLLDDKIARELDAKFISMKCDDAASRRVV